MDFEVPVGNAGLDGGGLEDDICGLKVTVRAGFEGGVGLFADCPLELLESRGVVSTLPAEEAIVSRKGSIWCIVGEGLSITMATSSM